VLQSFSLPITVQWWWIPGSSGSLAQLNGATSPVGLLQHGWMVDLIVAQQPVGDELRDAPDPFRAWGCHVLSFRAYQVGV
jgi:hypothetical protein